MRFKAEKTVQTEIMDHIKANGGYCVKVIRANDTGVHDILACLNGRFVSVEVKAEKFVMNPFKEASPRQKKHLKMVQEAKGTAMVVASLGQFIEGISYLDF